MVVVNQPTWRERKPVNLAAPLHDLPKHPERVLPKFNLGKGVSAEDHLKSFYMGLNNLNVDHEDVVFRIFLILLNLNNLHGTLFCKLIQ